MSIDYEYTRLLEARSNGNVQEHYFQYDNFDNGTGINVLFYYPALVSQIISSWENSTTMVLSIRLPSGVEYTVKSYSSVASFVLNHKGTGSNDFISWMKLPVGSRLRLGVDSANTAPGDLTLSIVAKPI